MKAVKQKNKVRVNTGKNPIQLVFVGDFFQLAPVINNKANESEFLTRFYKKMWAKDMRSNQNTGGRSA